MKITELDDEKRAAALLTGDLPPGVTMPDPKDQPISQVGSEEERRKMDEIRSRHGRPTSDQIEAQLQKQQPSVAMLSELASATSLSTPASASVENLDALAASGTWEDLELPSRCLPYSVKRVNGRPMDLTILSKVHEAQATGSLTVLLTALQPCVDLDIRALTVPDYYYFMYWLRLKSYPQTPIHINWHSRYGNDNSTMVTKTLLDILELEMTEETYQEWLDKGYVFPTMRDMEYMEATELEPSKEWEAKHAQYVNVVNNKPDADYMNRKIEAFHALGMSAVATITEFSSQMNHGVTETVKLTDEKFDPTTALDAMRLESKTMRKMIAAGLESEDPEQIKGMTPIAQYVEKLDEEIEGIEKALAEGLPFLPVEEVVTIGIPDVTLLFP